MSYRGGLSRTGIRVYNTMARQQLIFALGSFSKSQAFQSTVPPAIRTMYTQTTISSTHDGAFEKHLTDYSIHPPWCSQKPKLENIREALLVPMPSLSLSQTCDKLFKSFQQGHWQAKNEADVVKLVIPLIMGKRNASSPLAINKRFRNLEPLTNATNVTIPSAKPDFPYGATSADLDPAIRTELDQIIIPGRNIPILPNFFLEVKGPNGLASVATRQARYIGAIGARAMHRLQNYGQEDPIYDDNAYTFSSTYHYGLLTLFTHHPTLPATPGGRLAYHMTQLKSYALTNDRETFVEGVTAFRNMRKLAKCNRDAFIKIANSRHSDIDTAVEKGNKTVPRRPRFSQLLAQGATRSKPAR